MKAYAIVAVDVDGARYCPGCAAKVFGSVEVALKEVEECGYGGPVLASDLYDSAAEGFADCSVCFEVIGD